MTRAMTRRVLCLVVLALALAACGAEHLGDGYGRSYRNVFEAQRVSIREPDSPGDLDALDAANTMRVRHNLGDQGDKKAISAPTAGGGGSTAAPNTGVGAIGGNPIRLEAK